ncbi:Gfo/Idh/MocA family protein [Cyclobacterium qasimii]|uniref:Myo-inositol 2-dehydrogenase n=2 Tax=Cyclobacterium qasimii TaxID=1350429 RepID=S7V750_9BACT|nr:Gfo/Idh/MocA family oxidoreductase [Cyclobacterium qasimii]EPR65432.1 Myo-inositol 2-dehydrogenase [Cyclobacterium qasimii M12-11B]GEO20143.1 oxidoreductase [Cyclobacterium qasimii]
MNIAMLGSGFIARFYADTLHAQRRLDRIISVYSRNEENAKRFAEDYGLDIYGSSMEEIINNEKVDIVIISLPNHLHEGAVMACVEAGKAVLCTKPLGRTANEAKRMLDAVEKAGVFAGYLEDLCYTPKFLKSVESVNAGSLGKILWTKSREAHPGPHSDWFWDKEQSGGGAIIDLGCHCVEIGRNFIGKAVRPVEVMCWADTQVHPIDAEDHAIGLVKYENGAIGQFEVSWTFRGGMDLRDEVMGTEGTIWLNSFLRTGFDMFTTGKGAKYIAEKAESDSGWLFPVGDEAHELGYPHMFTDMFEAIDKGTAPRETFYDGYIVNAILDAAFLSAKSKLWEPIIIEDWRGDEAPDEKKNFTSHDADYFLIKKETLPNGDEKLILKHKETGKVIQKTTKA